MRARVTARRKGFALRILSSRQLKPDDMRALAHQLEELTCVTRAIVRGEEVFLKTRRRGRKVRRLLEAAANRILSRILTSPARKRAHKQAYVRAHISDTRRFAQLPA